VAPFLSRDVMSPLPFSAKHHRSPPTECSRPEQGPQMKVCPPLQFRGPNHRSRRLGDHRHNDDMLMDLIIDRPLHKAKS
jgi:hypothetical protein